jgi:hypothetical protein
MKITTKAADITDIEFINMSDVDPSTLEPTKKFGTDDNDLVDGKPVYRLPAIYVKEAGRQTQNISLKLRNKPDAPLEELQRFHLVGNVVITPWLKNNRVAYSLLADGVEADK